MRRKGQPETKKDVDAWFPTKTIHSILSLKKHKKKTLAFSARTSIPRIKIVGWLKGRPIFVAMS